MKRKEPTGEDAGRQLVVEEQQEEPSSNFLSALPDLALGAVLDFLQQQEEGAPTLVSKDEDSCRSSGACARSTFLHRYDEASEEPSPEEWAAYRKEVAARPEPPAHFSFEELMESDEPGRWASPSLLALRLTCRSVKRAVEAVARRGLFPQFELFTSVDRWLTWRVAWPTLVVAASPEEAHQQHLIREVESAAISCANARMHQLRLDAFLGVVLGETSEKRASLAQKLNYELSGGAEGKDDGRARLRVEYMTHGGDFLGCEAGMGLESCLSLSARPAARWGWSEELFVDLHTTSQAWSQALGLGLGEQQRATGATAASTSPTSDGGITKPLLTWQGTAGVLAKSTDDKLLGEIWRALGFTTDAPGRPAGDDDEEAAAAPAGVVWDCASTVAVLLAGLGYAWPPRDYTRTELSSVQLPRQAERFLQRKAVFDEANGFFGDHIDPVLAQLERRPQKLRGLRHVRRAIGQFFGQRRIALVGQALELHKTTEDDYIVTRRKATPDRARRARQVAEPTHTFLEALRFVEGRSISTKRVDDQQRRLFTSSSVRWVVRLSALAPNNHHHAQHSNADDGGGGGGGGGGEGHNDDQQDKPRGGKRRKVGPRQGTSPSSPIDVEARRDNDNNVDETRGGTGGRLVFSYDRKLSFLSDHAWHERLTVRTVMTDDRQLQLLQNLGAGEEHELYVAQYIDDAGVRGHQAKLAAIGRVLGLRPTAATITAASPSSSHVAQEEEARFGREVLNLLVMVANVAVWDAHPSPPPSDPEADEHLLQECVA